MRQRQFTYSLAIKKQGGRYLAYFPALPGCVAWGTTCPRAMNNAREALLDYLLSLESRGKRFPKDKSSDEVEISLGLTVRMPIIA